MVHQTTQHQSRRSCSSTRGKGEERILETRTRSGDPPFTRWQCEESDDFASMF